MKRKRDKSTPCKYAQKMIKYPCMANAKPELQARLQKIEIELKKLQSDFRDVKVRAKQALLEGLRRRDAKKIDEIRKRIGLK